MLQGGFQLVGDGLYEEWMIVPAFHAGYVQIRGQRFMGLLQLLEVGTDAHLRVMRRHAQRYHVTQAIVNDLRHGLADVRIPVPHTDVDPVARSVGCSVQAFLQHLSLGTGDVQQRRPAADESVPLPHFFHQIWRRLSAAPDVRQIGFDVIQRVWPAVGHQKDCVWHHSPPTLPPASS